MEFDENDDEMGIPDYGSAVGNAASAAGERGISGEDRGGGGGGYRYRECLKNHAVNIGGNAVDGCCEFMAAGDEGTIDALLCAACNCHRNFHRKEVEGGGGGGGFRYGPQSHHRYSGGAAVPAYPKQSRLLTLHSSFSREDDEATNPSSIGGGGGGGVGSKKRFRTKFSEEQKEKMLAFSESVGWRIQKQDEAAIEEFCGEAGVNRQVLKIWMHNNKQNLGKKP
ncbi:zinc-finger homeodomain protein 2-like [Impatiens glandulifera]|uniref:zinc-finger homeodomain protein 2-like n=1 Tax=Impatiens glandulifera TaxID=253017 RepID=UPI001FB09E54|nr:zinc-finger homeodomain protein 2-like [Impatiens glandulifera]